MTDQEKLVMFMKLKTNFLHANYGIKKSHYFIKKDVDSIMSWSNYISKKTYTLLKNQIKYDTIITLTYNTCVFCLKNAYSIEYVHKSSSLITKLSLNCAKCEYAVNHKSKCDNSPSFWSVRHTVENTHVAEEYEFSQKSCQIIIDIIEGKKNV